MRPEMLIQSPIFSQLVSASILSLMVVAIAWWRRSLSGSGAVAALLVGILTFGLGGWNWGMLLALFFVTSTLLSHYKEDKKRAVAEKFEKGSRRDMGQVVANGGVGALVALLSFVVPFAGWFPFFVGVMAAVTADTWATELGTLARRRPRMITSGRRVEVGTSGAISALGTAVSFAGGLLIGLTAGLLSDLSIVAALAMGGLGGLSGSLFDSLLGATAQQIFYCDTCRKETERKLHRCGQPTRPLRGRPWLNNDVVNLLSSLVGGSTALVLWLLV
jgi:uncharacterized protein (TIGR00297 family)